MNIGAWASLPSRYVYILWLVQSGARNALQVVTPMPQLAPPAEGDAMPRTGIDLIVLGSLLANTAASIDELTARILREPWWLRCLLDLSRLSPASSFASPVPYADICAPPTSDCLTFASAELSLRKRAKTAKAATLAQIIAGKPTFAPAATFEFPSAATALANERGTSYVEPSALCSFPILTSNLIGSETIEELNHGASKACGVLELTSPPFESTNCRGFPCHSWNSLSSGP